VVDELARRCRSEVRDYDKDYEALIGEVSLAGERVLLCKPLTYMNLSGRSVSAVQRFYKLGLPELLIVSDDLDLPVGQIRVRARGSAGGQKGLADVIAKLGSPDVPRLRIGIGKVHRAATVDHVLSAFAPDEREAAEQSVRDAADAAECWIREGIAAAMNRYNATKNKE
ncbi:MAG: aminoacyl-tRNA hydrolase, partial [Planctomycetes bacterium]|nr:aminoacyl-tRNA hydrolase [Planctomycetota bacterium]